jgi:hypothetical protein
MATELHKFLVEFVPWYLYLSHLTYYVGGAILKISELLYLWFDIFLS